MAEEGGRRRRRWGSKAYGPGCGGGAGDRRHPEKTKARMREADLGVGLEFIVEGPSVPGGG